MTQEEKITNSIREKCGLNKVRFCYISKRHRFSKTLPDVDYSVISRRRWRSCVARLIRLFPSREKILVGLVTNK